MADSLPAPVTREEEYLAAIHKELRALNEQILRLCPEIILGELLELKESLALSKPKAKRAKS